MESSGVDHARTYGLSIWPVGSFEPDRTLLEGVKFQWVPGSNPKVHACVFEWSIIG